MTRTQSTTHKRSQDLRVWLHWLVLILVVFAVFILVRLFVQHRAVKPPLDNPAAATPVSAPVQFDFYTVLPKMAVAVQTAPQSTNPASPAAKPKSTSVTPTPVTAPIVSPAPASAAKSLPTAVAVLQIAALRQLADAEHLRDQMRAGGYPAFIQSYQAGQVLWYRVMIGPYASLELAQHNQAQLKERGVASLLIRAP